MGCATVAGSITPTSLTVALWTHWFPPTIAWSTRWTAVPIGAVWGAATVVVDVDGFAVVDGEEEAVEQPARAAAITKPTVTRRNRCQFI
jgi:hypothetical protein